MLDPEQFRKHVIRPTISRMSLWSPSAENLLLCTATAESNLQYLIQLGGGPALGLFQMEPQTHDDIWRSWLRYRSAEFRNKIHNFRTLPGSAPVAGEMVGNLYYASVMCRLHYRRVPSQLPRFDDREGLAAYWKQHYNTVMGKGTVEGFIAKTAEIDLQNAIA